MWPILPFCAKTRTSIAGISSNISKTLQAQRSRPHHRGSPGTPGSRLPTLHPPGLGRAREDHLGSVKALKQRITPCAIYSLSVSTECLPLWLIVTEHEGHQYAFPVSCPGPPPGHGAPQPWLCSPPGKLGNPRLSQLGMAPPCSPGTGRMNNKAALRGLGPSTTWQGKINASPTLVVPKPAPSHCHHHGQQAPPSPDLWHSGQDHQALCPNSPGWQGCSPLQKVVVLGCQG